MPDENTKCRLLVTVAGTEWSLIARCLPAQDLRYQCSDDQLTAISYLHRLTGYKRQLPHVHDSLNPTDSHRSYPGLRFSDISQGSVATRSRRGEISVPLYYKFTADSDDLKP